MFDVAVLPFRCSLDLLMLLLNIGISAKDSECNASKP